MDGKNYSAYSHECNWHNNFSTCISFTRKLLKNLRSSHEACMRSIVPTTICQSIDTSTETYLINITLQNKHSETCSLQNHISFPHISHHHYNTCSSSNIEEVMKSLRSSPLTSSSYLFISLLFKVWCCSE